MSILSLALSLVAGGSLPSCDLSNMAYWSAWASAGRPSIVLIRISKG